MRDITGPTRTRTSNTNQRETINESTHTPVPGSPSANIAHIMITMFIVKLTHMSHLSCPVKPDRYVDVVTAVSILFTPSFMLLPPVEIKRLF